MDDHGRQRRHFDSDEITETQSMKLRLSILLLAAAALAAAPAAGQTIKSLGYNTTNGQIVYSGTNALTFTNDVKFNSVSATQINEYSGIRAIDLENFALTFGTNYVLEWSATQAQFSKPITFFGTNTASTTRTNLGLGATNYPTFAGIEVGGGDELQIDGAGIFSVGFDGAMSFEEQRLTQDSQTIFSWETNSFAVTPAATFATNVSVAGSLTVGSLTTTTPSTLALDATQTAADTNGVIALPDTANILRLTNANTISAVSNGRLGAFYFLLNQSGTNVVISNSATITARGATNITLGANESATLITTTATNATAH